MPRHRAEPIRKAALINAAIAEIGQKGSLDVTVSQIAKAAGMSPALAHHYFGSKEQIFLAAMRQVLVSYAATIRARLPGSGPRGRLDAIVEGSFDQQHFHRDVIVAWLNFFALALPNEQAARLLRVHHGRLRSNLIVALRGLTSDPAGVARTLGALIDGVYLRAVLSSDQPDPVAALRIVNDYLDEVLT